MLALRWGLTGLTIPGRCKGFFYFLEEVMNLVNGYPRPILVHYWSKEELDRLRKAVPDFDSNIEVHEAVRKLIIESAESGKLYAGSEDE